MMQEPVKQHEPLVKHLYTADPSAHVFEGKLYIYPSHDLDHENASNDNGDQYDMEDYHVLSLDNTSSVCVDHGQALHLRDIPWASAQLWAPDAAYRKGTYYLFFPARDKDHIFRIGVATSSSPSGSFTAEDDYIPGSFSIDPAVFIDEDERAYMLFGGLWGGQLEKWQNNVYDPEGSEPDPTAPALGPRIGELREDLLAFANDGADQTQELQILDEQGNPILAGDEDRRYFEGPWMHKYNGTYYLSYSTGSTHRIVYATSSSPQGPFTWGGVILNPVIGWTTHHSIVSFEGKWYLFYHDSSLSGGADNKRSVKFCELHHEADGSIRTINPYE